MTTRIASSVLIATLLIGVSTSAQSPTGQSPLAGRFMDTANGLSLEQAIARAIEQEPSLRAARSQLDGAKGTKTQASLRPNPSVSFDRREEPGGTDNLTTVGVQWPLDLFRRDRRIAVAAYRPGTPVGVTWRPLDMTMPGIGMLALARTVPTSTNVVVPVRLNSNVKLLRPCRRVPVGDSSAISRRPARIVCTTAPVL